MADVSKSLLENGICVLTEPMSGFRSISMGIWVNAGARDEAEAESGISHFIEHMIFKGTKRRSASQIAKEFDAIGGASNAFTSKEITCFHAKVMDVHLPVMTDLLSDIFLNSVFDPVELERERQVVLQEIGMTEDTPDDYVHILLSQVFWGSDHPLGRSVLGNDNTVSALDVPALKRYLSASYIPERIVISAAGNVEHKEFLDMLSRYFSEVPIRNGFPKRISPLIKPMISTHPKDLEQVHICLGVKGCDITSSRRYVMSLLNTLFGGSMSSRLFQEVRERRGLAYSIYSFHSAYEETGMLGVYAGVEQSSVDETISVILSEMKRLKKELISAEELDAAKEHVTSQIHLASESTDSRMNRLAQNEMYFGRYIPLSEAINGINQVTPMDVISLAEEAFQQSHFSAVFLGPVESPGLKEVCL